MPRLLQRRTTIRLATVADLAGAVSLLGPRSPRGEPRHAERPFIFSHRRDQGARILKERIADGCLLLASQEGVPCALAGVDPGQAEIRELLVAPDTRGTDLPQALLAGIERLAVRFGLDTLQVAAPAATTSFFLARGYRPQADAGADGRVLLQRSLRQRQTAYGRRIQTLCADLGVPADYGRRHRLALQTEARRLTSIGVDLFGREQFLAPRAAKAWRRMQAAALQQDVALQVVSAFRSADYQAGLLRRKLHNGQEMKEILRVSAAPGFSEHHTGRALDLTTPGHEALQEGFENSAAFAWLQRRAKEFGFRMSFPRDNRHRLAYEPWHWYFQL